MSASDTQGYCFDLRQKQLSSYALIKASPSLTFTISLIVKLFCNCHPHFLTFACAGCAE